MLKIVRELAIDNPWVLKIIMGVIAVTFVFTMGWWGIKAPKEDIVMSVNGHNINVREYRRAYNNAMDFYREMYKDKFDSEMLEKMNLRDRVMDDLAIRELWLDAAADLGLTVGEEELREGIMKMKTFHREGKFDRTLYERILDSNRMSVPVFEEAQRRELLIEKMKSIVRDSVSISDEEVNETFPLSASGAKEGVAARPPEEMQRLKKFLQFQKAEKAVNSYAAALRARAKVEVNKELL
jgi:peptidyl-prolyl cis-trans isomerase D